MSRHVSVLSLFSGIGLFDLGVLAAFEERGFAANIAAQVEIDPFCRRVLERHYPSTSRDVEDVRDVREWNTPWTDIIIGGFPCQDVSSAGKRVGMSGARSGLWWAFRDVVRAMRPRAVLVENVASGLRDWHGPVRCSLQAMGYRTVATQISAADAGAPHLRRRVFVLAYANGERCAVPWPGDFSRRTESCDSGHVADAGCAGRREVCCGPLANESQNGRWEEVDHEFGSGDQGIKWIGKRFKSGLDRATDGRAVRLDAHRWPAGRDQDQFAWEAPRTVDGGRWRRQRLRALGNAPTPQQALAAGRWALDVLGWEP